MAVRLVQHYSEEDSNDPILFEEVLEQRFKPGDLGKTQVTIDWDETMVEDDTGVQVFIQKLLDPHYWTVGDDEEFAEILLPKDHLNIYAKGACGLDPEINQAECQFALDLISDIFAFYKKIKERVVKGEFDEKKSLQDRMKDPMINEFARKMKALDELAMARDEILSKKLGGAFLLRTRFSYMHSLAEIREITERVWDHAGEVVNLKVHHRNTIKGNGRKISHRHPLIRGDNMREIKLCPTEDRRVVQIVHRLLTPGDKAIARVVTTNLPVIPESLIASSKIWRETILEPQRDNIVSENPLVHGTQLSMDKFTRTLKAITKGRPVHGVQKRELARQISRMTKRHTRIAMGDSPSGDLELGLQAIRGSQPEGMSYKDGDGIFIVVPKGGQIQEKPEKAVEAARSEFRIELGKRFKAHGAELLEIEKAIGDRIFYLMPEKQEAA